MKKNNFVDRVKQSKNDPIMQIELAKEFTESFKEEATKEAVEHMILVRKTNDSVKKLLLELAGAHGCLDSSDKLEQAKSITAFNNFIIRIVKSTFKELDELICHKSG